jgi:hypothetical protein
LHNIIKESVNNILSELDWRTYDSAYDKAINLANKSNDSYEKERREKQANEFFKTSLKNYDKQYNLPSRFDKLMKDRENGTKFKPTQGQLKNAAKRTQDAIKYYKGDSIYKDGKWQDK